MSNLFERLKTDLPGGWCSDQKVLMLASAVIALRPAITVELGVWFGRSLSALALAHKELGHGIVWAIDPWEKEASVEGMVNPADEKWWGEVDHEVVYQSFMETVNLLAIQNVVKIIRKRSDQVEPPDYISIMHSDGNHGVQAINDAERYGPKVMLGGLWIADDIFWSGSAVEASLKVLEKLGFVELYRVDDKVTDNTWAVLQRVKA